MASALNVRAICASLLVIAYFHGESHYVAEGFQVSLKMYFNTTPQGDYLHFETKHPNLGGYSDFFKDIKLVCGIGFWYAYVGVNYAEAKYAFGSISSNETGCLSYHYTGMGINSFRYLGSSDPTRDSLSLYVWKSHSGNELLIESLAYGGITSRTASICSTGKSSWTLFEGLNLDGKSTCFPAPSPGSYYAYSELSPTMWNITTVGSVFKGCDVAEIEDFKRNNNYSLY